MGDRVCVACIKTSYISFIINRKQSCSPLPLQFIEAFSSKNRHYKHFKLKPSNIKDVPNILNVGRLLFYVRCLFSKYDISVIKCII